MALPRRFRALLSVTPILARRTSACRKKALGTGPAPLCLRVENDHHPPPTVIVVPVTHSPPDNATHAIEISAKTKPRPGLDDQRSWIIVNEANIFAWPDPELREAGNRCLWFVAWQFVSRNARAIFARGCCRSRAADRVNRNETMRPARSSGLPSGLRGGDGTVSEPGSENLCSSRGSRWITMQGQLPLLNTPSATSSLSDIGRIVLTFSPVAT